MLLLDVLLGGALGYLASTLAESLLHNHVQHARPAFRRLCERHPRALGAFTRAYRSHHMVHHVWTYRQSYVTQFASEAEKRALDERLAKLGREGDRIQGEWYGLTLDNWSVLVFLAIVSPVFVPVVWLGGVAGGLACAVPVWIYPQMSRRVHPYLHMRHADALEAAPDWLAPLLRTRYVRGVWRNHWLHHRYFRFNFNLLLGGDVLLGVSRRPSVRDLAAMRAVGVPVD